MRFAARKSELLRRVSDTYRDALAEYIVHRKAVIEVADQLRSADDTGSMSKVIWASVASAGLATAARSCIKN